MKLTIVKAALAVLLLNTTVHFDAANTSSGNLGANNQLIMQIGFNSALANDCASDPNCSETITFGDSVNPDWSFDLGWDFAENRSLPGDLTPPYGGAGGGGGNGGQDACGGSCGSAQKQTPKQQCISNVDRTVLSCKNTYTWYTSGAGLLCLRVPTEYGKAGCGATVTSLIYQARDWCDYMGNQKKARDC